MFFPMFFPMSFRVTSALDQSIETGDTGGMQRLLSAAKDWEDLDDQPMFQGLYQPSKW
jgi:hypothetical protein